MGSCTENAAHQLVCPLSGCDVQYALCQPTFDEGLHGATSSTGGMKDKNLEAALFQMRTSMLDTGCCVAKHACDDGRFLILFLRKSLDHAADGSSPAFHDPSEDTVEA